MPRTATTRYVARTRGISLAGEGISQLRTPNRLPIGGAGCHAPSGVFEGQRTQLEIIARLSAIFLYSGRNSTRFCISSGSPALGDQFEFDDKLPHRQTVLVNIDHARERPLCREPTIGNRQEIFVVREENATEVVSPLKKRLVVQLGRAIVVGRQNVHAALPQSRRNRRTNVVIQVQRDAHGNNPLP